MAAADLSNMPSAEVDITVALVKGLLAEQHPDLADLPLDELGVGWDNVMYRLGSAYTVRLPRRQQAAELIEHEQRWLPVLAPSLPLPVPVPVRVGHAGKNYPWSWSVLPWFDGVPAGSMPLADQGEAAEELGRFLAALHTPASPQAPANPGRGGPLATRHAMTIERIDAVFGDGHEREEVMNRWQRCTDQIPYDGPPVWLHGDLHPLNVLQSDDRISAVIDFGDITSGDPAADLAIGYSLFDEAKRATFRKAAERTARPIDDAMWIRAEGWSISVGLAILANSADSPTMHALGRRMLFC